MKKTFLYILAMFFFLSCTQKQTNQSPRKTIIAGQVTNFSEVAEHNSIEFIFPDVVEDQKKYMETIDSDGYFRFEIDLNHPIDFYLKYSGVLTFFASPGDSLYFTIDNACWKVTAYNKADEYAFYKLSGTNEKMNHDVVKFITLFNDSVFSWEQEGDTLKTFDALGFKNYKERQLKEHSEFLNRFNLNEDTDPEFQLWASNYLKYTNRIEMMQYRWVYPMQVQTEGNPMEYVFEMPVEYFDFLKELPDKRTKDLDASAYYNMLMEYAVYTDQIIPLDTQRYYQGIQEKNPEKAYAFFPNYYQKTANGFLKDVLIAKYYYRMLGAKFYPTIKKIFNPDLIEDKELREQVIAKYNYEKALFEKPEYATGTHFDQLSSESNLMQDLISKYPDKVIYIDFWAPWCSPCMGEMPAAKKMKEKFVGKDVVFVYLANRCEDRAWKSTIAEKKIEGEHYLLTDKQFAELSQIFEVPGIPHYVLIDKNGRIINPNAPRPSSGEVLEKAINELL